MGRSIEHVRGHPRARGGDFQGAPSGRAAVRVNGLLILDWPVSDDPREGGGWINVTTWSREQQDALCARIGLKRIDSDLPWPVFRAVKAAT